MNVSISFVVSGRHFLVFFIEKKANNLNSFHDCLLFSLFSFVLQTISFGKDASENYLNWWKYLLTFNDNNNIAVAVGCLDMQM